MDPKQFINFLSDTLSVSNPGMVSIISHMEIASFQNRIFLSIPDTVSVYDANCIQDEIARVPAKIKGEYPVVCYHMHNLSITDPHARAVLGEAIADVIQASGTEANPKFVPSSVAFFLAFMDTVEASARPECIEDLKLFGVDGKFHRLIVLWGPDEEPETYEFNKKVMEDDRPVKKAVKPTTKVTLEEMADPVRDRTRRITNDDITNLKILLGPDQDVNDIIAQLDTIGTGAEQEF